MSKVVTYKNDSSGCFCQIKFDSGERILVSMAVPGVKISKLLFGIIPTRTLWELSSIAIGGTEPYIRRLVDIFSNCESDNIPHPLDAIKDMLLPCRSIEEMLQVIANKEKEAYE